MQPKSSSNLWCNCWMGGYCIVHHNHLDHLSRHCVWERGFHHFIMRYLILTTCLWSLVLVHYLCFPRGDNIWFGCLPHFFSLFAKWCARCRSVMCSLKFCCLMLYIFLAKCQQVFTILAYYYFVNCLVCRLSLDLRRVYGRSYTSLWDARRVWVWTCLLPAVVVWLLEPLWSFSIVHA